MNQSTAHFAEIITIFRKMARLSLQVLADKMHSQINKQAIHQFKQGKSKPEADAFLTLAKALNVHLDFFFNHGVGGQ